MRRTVGFALDGLRAAEEEVVAAGIAHRPTACAAIQLKKRAALPRTNIGADARMVDMEGCRGDPDGARMLVAQARHDGTVCRSAPGRVTIFRRRPPRSACAMWGQLNDARATKFPSRRIAAD